MTLPASGTITVSQISVELGRASTATTSIGGASERALAGVPEGVISMSNFYGKTQSIFTNNVIFTANGIWKVPTGVNLVRAHVWGAGGGGHVNSPITGGFGGYSIMLFITVPGENLNIRVGGGGGVGGGTGAAGTAGAGAGGAGSGSNIGGGGGGGSGVFRGLTNQTNALVVAGGGGGAVQDAYLSSNFLMGGGGGGKAGNFGGGWTFSEYICNPNVLQHTGGSGGGGDCLESNCTCAPMSTTMDGTNGSTSPSGGGGGGGFWGGGGGGGPASKSGGGGGGSGYVKNVTGFTGSWLSSVSDPFYPPAPYGRGGNTSAGGGGYIVLEY